MDNRTELLNWIRYNDSVVPPSISDDELLELVNSFGYEFSSIDEAHEELCRAA